MAKVAKSFRFDAETWERLSALAEARNENMTATMRSMIDAEYLKLFEDEGSSTNGGTQQQKSSTEAALAKTLETLADQLSVKDAQIAEKDKQIETLGNALAAAQDSTKAAQTLHAVELSPALEAPREGIWARIKRAFS